MSREMYVLNKVAGGTVLPAAQAASWLGLDRYLETLAAGKENLPPEQMLETPLTEAVARYRRKSVQELNELNPTDIYITLAGLTMTLLTTNPKTDPTRLVIPTPNERADRLHQWAFDPIVRSI